MPVACDAIVRLQAAAFVDAQSLKQDSEFVPGLLNRLAGREFQAIPVPKDGPEDVLAAFLSLDGVSQLVIQPARFDYNLQGPLPIAEGPTWETFVESAAEVLGAALDESRRVARRVAFNVRMLATDRVPRSCTTDEIAARLLLAPPTFEGRTLGAWIWKLPYKDLIAGEECNFLPQVSSQTGAMNGEFFGAIDIQFDVNTLHENARLRFDSSNISTMLSELVRATRQLESELNELLGDY